MKKLLVMVLFVFPICSYADSLPTSFLKDPEVTLELAKAASLTAILIAENPDEARAEAGVTRLSILKNVKGDRTRYTLEYFNGGHLRCYLEISQELATSKVKVSKPYKCEIEGDESREE